MQDHGRLIHGIRPLRLGLFFWIASRLKARRDRRRLAALRGASPAASEAGSPAPSRQKC